LEWLDFIVTARRRRQLFTLPPEMSEARHSSDRLYRRHCENREAAVCWRHGWRKREQRQDTQL